MSDFNIKELAKVFKKHDLWLNSTQTDHSLNIDDEDDLNWLEENVDDGDYSELSSYDFYLTYYAKDFTCFYNLHSDYNMETHHSFYRVTSHYSISCNNLHEYYEKREYIEKCEELKDELNEELSHIHVWMEEL